MLTSAELINLVLLYDKDANTDLIKKAYVFAMEAHGSQKRASGFPYFTHPVEVSKILAEMRMDVPTVVTGLLHDVLEDTNTSYEEIVEIFGAEIAFLVDGVTKLSKINFASTTSRRAENFKKFLIAMAQDIRVLVVKLVDRLHNIRTLHYIDSVDKQKRIAAETLDIYAPLAERIGMRRIKTEIEDIAFYNLHPEEYQTIAVKLEEIKKRDADFIPNTMRELEQLFKDSPIPARISGREKEIYSIWRKMQKRNVSLNQIYDIMAFRVIVDTVEQCYESLGLIHTNFRIMPGRFKDYISIPKLNNYRSLHTTVVGPFNQPIEIQIRTEEMHRIAEDGVAAHWLYKSDNVSTDVNDSKNFGWLKGLLTTVKNSDNPEEVLANSKLEMFDDEVFCFTETGDLKTLPKGATAIDFAYSIHTDVGDHCIGVQINTKMVPLWTPLRNGDRIKVLTSPYQHPDSSWINFATTGKARACVKKYIHTQEKSEFLTLGRELAKYAFKTAALAFDEDAIQYKKFRCNSLQSFYQNFGRGLISFVSFQKTLVDEFILPAIAGDAEICMIDFIPGIAVHLAECCHPIIGDKIVGVIQKDKGLVVHSLLCPHLSEHTDQVLLKMTWNQDNDQSESFTTVIRILTTNDKDSFALITNIISSNGASITNLRIEERSMLFFTLLIEIKVTDTFHLGEILAALRACSHVKSVHRD